MDRRYLLILLILAMSLTTAAQANWILHCDSLDPDKCGYVDKNGRVKIPLGKYRICFTDTFKHFAVVLDDNNRFAAINKEQNVLFYVLPFDNGPDYTSEGLFRIIDKGKIGYANMKGEIVIKPTYQCALPFEDGKAKVTRKCEYRMKDEHPYLVSSEWFFIDHSGKKVDQ